VMKWTDRVPAFVRRGGGSESKEFKRLERHCKTFEGGRNLQ
jgi:hypothetical protein